MQALILTGMRGPDGCSKHNPAKEIVRFLRGAVIKPAGDWNGENNNDFMWGNYKHFNNSVDDFFNNPDSYPHHFIMHLIHCAEVIVYKHPNLQIKLCFNHFYKTACKSFHMNIETEAQMDKRLNDFGFAI